MPFQFGIIRQKFTTKTKNNSSEKWAKKEKSNANFYDRQECVVCYLLTVVARVMHLVSVPHDLFSELFHFLSQS